MKNSILFLFVSFCFTHSVYAQEVGDAEANETEEVSTIDESNTPGATAENDDTATQELPAAVPGGPKTMSGMSILGNEETPKSLVIVPWKSSEMGDELSLSDTLDERAQPVDKEVFMRELDFYQIRSAKQ